MESSASNSYRRPDSRASLSSNNETLLTNEFPGFGEMPDEVVERFESSLPMVHIDLSAIPEKFHAKAKEQVLGNCYVKIRDLAILVNSSKDNNERKAVKRPRDDSLSRNNENFTTARISTKGQHWKLPKKKSKALKNPESYNVRNVSETRLVVQKKLIQYELPQCTPLRPDVEYEETDTDPIAGPSHNYRNHYVTSSVPTVFPRKNHPILQNVSKVHGESVMQPELNTKSKSVKHSKGCVNVGTQTEPQPQPASTQTQFEFLQRRISELELMMASNRSFQTPSPLPQKNQDDAASALSTPPNSDSGSCNGGVEKKSESSSSKRNSTPTKSAFIVVNRLTDSDLRQYGVGRNSSVSPTEETRPKKRPRLSSSVSDSERHSFKKPEKRSEKPSGKDLFGEESDEDMVPHPKKVLEKPQPLDMDELNYDFDEEEEVEESRPASVDKQKKSNETNQRDKSSKSDKKEKTSEKDKRKEKERKKKDSDKTKAGEHSKSSKEKSGKESRKSGKNPVAAVNTLKYKIPKKSAPPTVGLPPDLQQNLDQFTKGYTQSPAQQTVSLGTSESVLPKNTVVKPNDLANVPSTSKNAVKQPVAPESFEFCDKTATPILCNPRESVKGRITKSVNFREENLESVRTISPLCQFQQAERAIEVPSVREKYIPLIINDLTYEPKSSPRKPVVGIRPFRPPTRRIGDERGGRRFDASSSSSSSDSASEMSENESSDKINTNEHSGETISALFPPNDLRLSVENQSISNGSSVIPEESSGDPTAQEMEETTTHLSSTASDELCTPSSAVEPVSIINNAATGDSTKEGSSSVVPKENAQAVTPKKLPIPSLAVPPSPRRQTPEPISQVSSTLVKVKSSIPMEDDDSEEEDDVLDIGLNESFGYEEEELPPPKLPSNTINNAPAKIVFDRPSPAKIVAPLNKANDPAMTVKPPIIQRTVMANPPYPQDDVASTRGLCFDLVRSGGCKLSDTPNKKCDFSHDLNSALDFVNYLCNKKGSVPLAYRLVCCMTNIDSPLNKTLSEPLGVRIVGTVIKAIVMGNRQEYMSIALEMLCDKKLPLIPEFVDGVIKQTPVSSASVNHLVSLYERCQSVDSYYKMSLVSFYKVTAVLVDHWEPPLKKWEFICNIVELASSNYPQSFRPSYEVLCFLFGEAHDQLRLERLCILFNGIEPPVIALLGPEKRHEILNRLRNFGLVHWYDRYAGIRRPVEVEMHAMPNSIRPTQSQLIGAQQYLPNGMANHPPRGAMQPVLRAPHPSMPLAHQMPSLRQPNYGSQFPLMPPVGLQRPSVPTFPSPSLHRPQPPIVPAVGVHRPQPPNVPAVGVHRQQPPTVPAVGVHRPQPPAIPMGHSIVNVLHPQAPPSVPNSIFDLREKVNRPVPYENGSGPVPSSSDSLAASNPASPPKEVYPDETKKTTPIIALEVPKPAHSLDLNLFEPESPEVEPVFLEESEEEKEPQEPRVVVELSHAGEDELLTEFNKQNFKAVTSWYLQHYTGDRKCRMLAQLVHLIKTNPIYDSEGSNQAMSPGHIAFKILHTAFVDEEGNPTVLDPRQRQALCDLIFFVLYHFLEMSMTDDEDERMVQAELAKNFLELLMVFQELVPLEDFIKHPGLLQFVAKCSLEVYLSKEEDEEDFLGVVVPHIERAIMLLTEFHKIIKKIPSYVNFDLVRQDMDIADQLLQTLGDFHQREGADRFSAGIAGLYDDYNNAALCNKSLFQALLPSG